MKKKAGKSHPLRLEWVAVEDLAENPQNWRRHPEEQRKAFEEAFAAVGWAGALVLNEKTGRLVDGHLRKAALPAGTVVPVLVGSWSEEQERLILATHDPVGGMAEVDPEAFEWLREHVSVTSEALTAMWDDVQKDMAELGEVDDGLERYVIVECKGEKEQRKVFERWKEAGYGVRVMTI